MAAGRFRSPPPLSPANPTSKRRHITEIAARRTIQPFRQGELDCFCGLYSCLNALRLAAHATRPIPKSLATTLYQEGIGYLDGKDAVGVTATDGMHGGRQRYLLAYLARKLRATGIQVAIERPPISSFSGIADVLCWMEAGLAKGAAVMTHLGGAREHYSVIAGMDGKNLHLFDSSGLQRIARAGCGVGQTSRHIIDPQHLVSVRIA